MSVTTWLSPTQLCAPRLEGRDRRRSLPATIRRVREKLKLSQREAGACSNTERTPSTSMSTEVEPSSLTSQLLRLLDQHSELIEELRESV